MTARIAAVAHMAHSLFMLVPLLRHQAGRGNRSRPPLPQAWSERGVVALFGGGLADDADALPAQTDRDLIGSDLVLQAGALLALVLGDAVAALGVAEKARIVWPSQPLGTPGAWPA